MHKKGLEDNVLREQSPQPFEPRYKDISKFVFHH
jgi:hypothetical protein